MDSLATTQRAPTDPKPAVSLPRLGPGGMLRRAWRQLTSMRSALFLLLLLAVAAVPGSLFPQRSVNPAVVARYLAPAVKQTLKVNDPVTIGGASVYLVGNGYAPDITVKDGTGTTSFSGPVASVPSDGAYTSLLVLKVPDAVPSQLGFVGFFLSPARPAGSKPA